jgi:hypothetical protein
MCPGTTTGDVDSSSTSTMEGENNPLYNPLDPEIPASLEGEEATKPQPACEGDLVPSFTLGESLLGLNYWILTFAIFGGCGAGLMLINNLGQIVPSYLTHLSSTDQKTLTTTLVSFVGISNCGGRLLAGLVSDHYVRKTGIARPHFFGFACALMAGACGILYLFDTAGALYIASMCGGVSFGMMNALNPMLASEVFGQKHMGAHYATLSVAMALASYILATKVASSNYQSHCAVGSNKCFGHACFKGTMLLSCLLSAGAAVVSFVLGVRAQPRYSAMYKVQR